MNEINTFLTYLQSQQTAQKYLHQCYQHLEDTDAQNRSYENCNTFIYYLNHGQRFYENGRKADPLLQPVLYFYGMVHLVKACLLTKRPYYPESAALLAHGVTARKRKKKNYSFLKDEVKIQHNGLYPYFSEHLFSHKKHPFEKKSMESLLALLPEMIPLFDLQKKVELLPVGKLYSNLLQFPTTILDSYHLTEKAFINKISGYVPDMKYVDTDDNYIRIELTAPIKEANGPFYANRADSQLFFPSRREQFLPIPEVMIHYLILYNLSMLCRYEAEWWGDLFSTKPEIDYPFIRCFLQLTADKIPFLLGKYLYALH
ncbi:YaaC family protein [Virgibacillus halodenitrificans]|uniref:YaaC family protein n=1 Tax=Virgibacillus halodenitrificans TaxID=1482 RepID=UPI001F30CEF2|nr:YaaC family protein [Virgibacillus halodenitrificans]MCG1027543.1 YaaC family protein [Virgibacillus halodenitrificans]